MNECTVCGEKAKEIYKEHKACDDPECKTRIDELIKIGVLEG